MTGDETRPDLVRRLRAGDPAAAEELDREYRAHLVRFCFGYLRSVDEAEDAVQDVFAKLWKADALPQSLRAWLYTVARNHCLNALRGRGRRPDAKPMPSDMELVASCTGLPTRLVRQEEYGRIERLVADLSEAERELIRLRYGEDLSREEIAQVLELPVSTVKSRLFETMKKLRQRAEGS